MIAEVIVDVLSSEVDRVFDYNIPSSLAYIASGYRVQVPFGNRRLEGFVVATKETTDCPKDKLKDIICSLDDFPVLRDELINLVHYMKNNLRMFRPCLNLQQTQ